MNDKCPVCGKTWVVRCRCPRGDTACPEGHEWHTCTVHGRVVLGPSDHATPTHFCTCPVVLSLDPR